MPATPRDRRWRSGDCSRGLAHCQQGNGPAPVSVYGVGRRLRHLVDWRNTLESRHGLGAGDALISKVGEEAREGAY